MNGIRMVSELDDLESAFKNTNYYVKFAVAKTIELSLNIT